MPCRREDLPQVEAILRKTPEAASWSEASLAAILEENPEYFLLSWEGEDLGGFIYGRRVLDEGEILNLAVECGLSKTRDRRRLSDSIVWGIWPRWCAPGVSGSARLRIGQRWSCIPNWASCALGSAPDIIGTPRRQRWYCGGK